MGESAHSRERWAAQREIRGGVGAARVGGKVAITTAPPHQYLCDTRKISAVSKTASRFGPEALVKTKFVIKIHKKRTDRAF